MNMQAFITLLVEPTMYFAIGFLLAALLSLPFVGAVHRRAVRLTTYRLNATVPISVDELRAEKDLLRAEFAVTTQRLESTLDDMKTKTAAQRAEIGRQSHSVTTLKSALGEKARTICALEARETALKDQLRTTEQEHALKSINLEDARRMLQDKEAELAKLAADLGTRTVIAEQQNVELASARAQVEALKTNVQGLNREVDGLNARLVRYREDIEKASKELVDERGKVENLGRRVADLEVELIAQRSAADALRKVTAERFCEQARLLAAREYETDRLHIALEGARRSETSLRSEIAEIEKRHTADVKAVLADKAALETNVERLAQERQQLQWELTTLQQAAEKAQAAEHIESALIRERIDGVSEQVALLGTVLKASLPERDGKSAAAAGSSRNGHAANNHDVAAHAPFTALLPDDIFVNELPNGREAATARAGPN